MIPFADLVAALERYKRRKELEAATGQPQAQQPAAPPPQKPTRGSRS